MFLLMNDTNVHHRLSFVQNIKETFTLHWHPSRYFDPVFTSVSGCKKIFLSRSLAGLKPSMKTFAVMRLLIPGDIPSPYRVTVCFVPFSALLFGLPAINGGLFQRSRWSHAHQQLERNILLWLHQQVIIFLGGEWIILGTHCACSPAILVI